MVHGVAVEIVIEMKVIKGMRQEELTSIEFTPNVATKGVINLVMSAVFIHRKSVILM
jgi:hypothetical protein